MKKQWIFLGIILLIAAFFRIWQIWQIPPGLYPDEAMNGMDALNQGPQVFYQNNNGREGLFITIQWLFLKVFGPETWALRLVSAIIGILTVLGLYLLAKQLFNKKVALFSSFLLAVSFWHINFSRIGFRAIMVPFCLVFFLYYFYRKKYILAGLFFGLGFNTYLAWRFMILALPFLLWKLPIKKTALFLLIAFIVCLPIGLYFLQNPAVFIGRAGGVSVFATENWLKALAASTVKTLASFNFIGDFNWRHNYASSPLLFWPVGILFLIGLAKAIYKRYYVLLILFGLMLLPAVLTYEALPHALRMIGVIPIVYLFAGIGLDKLKLSMPVLLIFLLVIAGAQYHKYFLDWGKRQEVKDAFSQDLVDIGNHLIGKSAFVKINAGGVLVDGIPMPAQTIKFITYQKAEINYVQDLSQVPIDYQCENLGPAIICQQNNKFKN